MNKWDLRMMEMANLVSTWSKDPGAQIGAVIVDTNNRVISLGFNGFPRGVRDDPAIQSDRERKLKRTIHAEENAMLFSQRPLDGCTIYVNAHPCARCAAKIIQIGITRVVCKKLDESFEARWADEFSEAAEMFAEAHIHCEVLP